LNIFGRPKRAASPTLVTKPAKVANIKTSTTLTTSPTVSTPSVTPVAAPVVAPVVAPVTAPVTAPVAAPAKILSKFIGSRHLAVDLATAPKPTAQVTEEIPTTEPTNPKFPKRKEHSIAKVLVALDIKKFNPIDKTVTVTKTLPYETFDAALG
jgi:hypothetical protein